MPLKIAIIGAGPAGLLLARLLYQANKGIEFEIFDSASALETSEDYILDVHQRNAKVALKFAGLWDAFSKSARWDGDALTISDKKLFKYHSRAPSKPGSVFAGAEIGKNKLREILCNGLPEKSFKWGWKVQRIDTSNGVHIYLNNGQIEKDFDLIVGADGINSAVRPSLSDIQPIYTGIAGHIAQIPDAKTNSPALVDLLDKGRLYSWSEGKSLIARYLANGSIALESWSARPQGWSKNWKSEEQSTKSLGERYSSEYAGWNPSLLSLVQEADWSHAEAKNLHTLPNGFRWEHQPGLTLIGDAAHAILHLGGEGLGIAFWDCIRLSKAVISSASVAGDLGAKQGALDKRVAGFEEDMFGRIKASQHASFGMVHAMFFVPGTPRTSIEKYSLAALEVENGYWRTMVLSPFIYLYWSFFKWMYQP